MNSQLSIEKNMMYSNISRSLFNNFFKIKLFSRINNYHSDNVFGYKRNVNKTTHFKIPDQWHENRCEASNLYRLITAYRKYGHKYANINPLASPESFEKADELNLQRYGFNENDFIYIKEGLINYHPNYNLNKKLNIAILVKYLQRIYCNNLSAEFDYLESEEEYEWFIKEYENISIKSFDETTKLSLAKILIQSETFDNFLAKKFSSLKRYGAEGAESMMVFFQEILNLSAKESIEEISLAIPHRGRLNLLTGLLNYPPRALFKKLQGIPDFPEKYECTGDVLSHIISSSDIFIHNKKVHVTVLRNPSHLEAVNPVSMGKARAKHLNYNYGNWGDKILNIQVHGDAAFVGQGINQECLQLSKVPHFEIGGTIHFIVNNHLGFTTPSARGRSSPYCSDLVKSINMPVIHVNGDYPEELLKATKLAFDYQRKFRKDILIDMNCFRKLGHNEMDDPTFTNPAIYSIINSKKSVPRFYCDTLLEQRIFNNVEEFEKISNVYFEWLNDELKYSSSYSFENEYFKNNWSEMQQAPNAITTWDTGVDADVLKYLGKKSVQYPQEFEIHPTIERVHVKSRLKKLTEEANIDWSTAETLAVASLLFQGFNVRISGQDVGRGTFSQRHAMLVDQKTNSIFIPLNQIHLQSGFLELANSILSEEAVLGYEYGMSLESPNNLIIWEAQFGDFVNGAQIILDSFISSGEAKWIYQTGLIILLPHGYDGAGPEHSSCRLERFLQLTNSKQDKIDGDNVNMQICQPSTPAQYFHLIRRQMVRNFRKPLIVVTPKTLLRDSKCVSTLSDMNTGQFFKPVLSDFSDTCITNPEEVDRVIITSGKHFYSLIKVKSKSDSTNKTVIIRLESFCPFPAYELLQEIAQFKNVKDFIWCQEEPQNMGAWNFIKTRFENLIGKSIKYCGRPTQAAPAVGIPSLHFKQQEEILNNPFII